MQSTRNSIISKIRMVHASDIIASGKMLISIPYYLYLKRKGTNIWLVLERKNEARDNGIAFFQYAVNNSKGINVYYVINRNSQDYIRVKKYEPNVIEFGSIKHWAYYFAAKAIISSQKNMGPDDLLNYFLKKRKNIGRKMFFLGHGITKDDAEWIHFQNTNFRLFCCGATKEYEFVKKEFGYPENNVANCGGLCRYDLMCLDKSNLKRQILVMPTFREWLYPDDPRMFAIEHTFDFKSTEYFCKWDDFLNSQDLCDALNKYNVDMIFYPHPSVQQHVRDFNSSNDHVVIADWKDWDLQKLIHESAMLITDYSSVFFDFVFMDKPIVFYQFDEQKYRANQYAQGYFDYHNNGFARSEYELKKVIVDVVGIIQNKFCTNEKYKKERNIYFPIIDHNNAKRTFDEIYSRVIQ